MKMDIKTSCFSAIGRADFFKQRTMEYLVEQRYLAKVRGRKTAFVGNLQPLGRLVIKQDK